MLDVTYLETAIVAARSAGDVLRDWAARFTVREKGPANLVTEADYAAQDAIVAVIRAQFPDHGFLGEEALDQPARNEPFRWIIDPLDGTSNYVHGFPYYAVSIGLEHNGEMVLGVIYDPNRDEVFAAQRGKGATLNERKIQPSGVNALGNAFVVASLPTGAEVDDPAVARLLRVLPHAQTVQRTGSAALNLAYVACGRIDAFWSSSLKPWDVAAGSLIVAEAGGAISRMSGEDFDVMLPDLLSTNGSPIHQALSDLLTRINDP
jgi:myo-inositol-1(or 4)-monophosphatase